MAFSFDVFQIVFFVFLLGLGSEVVLYIWCYQSSSFRTIDQAINKQSRKSDGVKGPIAKSNRTKKTERVEGSLKKAATKELAVMKVKQSLVVCGRSVSWCNSCHQICSTSVLSDIVADCFGRNRHVYAIGQTVSYLLYFAALPLTVHGVAVTDHAPKLCDCPHVETLL